MSAREMTPFQQQASDAALTSEVAVGFLINAAVRDARKLLADGRPGQARFVLSRVGMRLARLTGERFECSPEFLAAMAAVGWSE